MYLLSSSLLSLFSSLLSFSLPSSPPHHPIVFANLGVSVSHRGTMEPPVLRSTSLDSQLLGIEPTLLTWPECLQSHPPKLHLKRR